MILFDSLGRRIDYLRLSVTKQCNLRCVYCLPETGYRSDPNLLNDDEILRLLRSFSRLGVGKIRVTGGEPLVRPNIVSLINGIKGIDGIEDISMSTNGLLLSQFAQELKDAGLCRVNISLDSLSQERFGEISRLGKIDQVLRGIETALRVGLTPVKINVVVMRGLNHTEIPEFVSLAKSMPVHVRFIELMPIGETGFFSRERWVPLSEMKAMCGYLEPLNQNERPIGFGPASYFRPPGGTGTVGFIGALSCNFCGNCNRLRLTADGKIHPCLASDQFVDLRGALNAGRDSEKIEELVQRAVSLKPEKHDMCCEQNKVREAFMCALGG